MNADTIANTISEMNGFFEKDLLTGYHKIVLMSTVGEENVLTLSHDCINLIRAICMHSVDYPNSFLYHKVGRDIDGIEIVVPAIHYMYHWDESNQHIERHSPYVTIRSEFQSNHVEILIQCLYFPIDQFVINAAEGEFIQPWYDYYRGIDAVRCEILQTEEDRMIDHFCEKLCEVLPYDKNSPYNARIYRLIHPPTYSRFVFNGGS